MHLSTVCNLVRSFGSKVFLSKKSTVKSFLKISSVFVLVITLLLSLTFNSSLSLVTTTIARQNAVTNLLQKLGLSNLLDSKLTAQAQTIASSSSSSRSSISSVSSSSNNLSYSSSSKSSLSAIQIYPPSSSSLSKSSSSSVLSTNGVGGVQTQSPFQTGFNPKLQARQMLPLNNIVAGQSNTIKIELQNTDSNVLSNALFFFEIFNSSNISVANLVVDNFSIQPNETKIMTWDWTPPISLLGSQNQSTTLKLRAGLFSSDWSKTHNWWEDLNPNLVLVAGSSQSSSSVLSSSSSFQSNSLAKSILNSVNPNFGIGVNNSGQLRVYDKSLNANSVLSDLSYDTVSNQIKNTLGKCFEYGGFGQPPILTNCDSNKLEQKWELSTWQNDPSKPLIKTKKIISLVSTEGVTRNEQLCLDVDYWADGTFKNDQRLVSYFCWGGENQAWSLVNSTASQNSSLSSSSNSSNTSNSITFSQDGINFNVAIACVDDGEVINGQSSFSVVIKYTNSSGRIELANSQLNPSRPVIHTHFDLKNRSTLNYADPAVANTLNGPITYFKNGNSSPVTESKAMVIQGLGSESVSWKFNILNTQGNSIKNSNGTTRDFEVSTNRNFATKCTQNSKRTITDNKIDTNPPIDPSFKFDPVYSTIVPTDTTQFNYKLSTADSTGTDNSEVKFTNSGIINDQQKWYFDSRSKLIKSIINNKCLATTGNQTWSKIVIKTCNSTDNTQTWDISGNFIKNLASNNCINSQWSRLGTTDNYENKWYEGRPAVLDNGCYWGFKFVSLPKTSSSSSSQSNSSSSLSTSSSSNSQILYNYITNKVNSSFVLGNTSDTNIKSLNKGLAANSTNAKKWYYNSTTQQFKTSANQCLQNSGYNQPVTIQACSDTLESQKWLVNYYGNDSNKPVIITQQSLSDYQGVQQKMCLDVNYWSAGGFADNQSLVAYSCWGGENQLWQLESNSTASWNLDWLKVLNPFGGIQASAETDQEYCTRASGLKFENQPITTYPYTECNSVFNPNIFTLPDGSYYEGRTEVYKFGGNSNFALDHDAAGNVFLSEFTNSPTQKWKSSGYGYNGLVSDDSRCLDIEGANQIIPSQYVPGMLTGKKVKLKPCSDHFYFDPAKDNTNNPGLFVQAGVSYVGELSLTLSILNDQTSCMTVEATDNINLSNKPIIVRPCPKAKSERQNASDHCFNFFKPVVFDRATQAKIEIARQGYACDPLYANASDDDLDEFSFGNDNETLEVIESAVQSNPETDVFKLAKQASDTTFGELQKILDGVNTCGTWDVSCKTTNSTFQSSAITMANVSGKLLFGLLVGIGSTIALDAIVKAILSSAFKIVGIFISIIALIYGTIAIFQNMGTILQSYINLPIEDKAYAVGNIIGGVVGSIILGVDPSKALDNVAQTIGNIASKASSINVKSITATLLAAKQSLIKFGLNVFENSGKVVVKVNDLLKAIRTGGQAAFDKLKVLLGGSEKYAKTVTWLSLIVKRDSLTIRFSQSTISKTFTDGNTVDDLILQLINGTKSADTLSPITIIKMSDGLFTSLDNRRLYAFQKANKPIAIIERGFDELLDSSLTSNPYLMNKYKNPKTYGELINARIKDQSPASWRVSNPNGSQSFPTAK